jgi:integrase
VRVYQETGHVFTREDGSWLHPERFADAFHWLTRGAGLPRIRIHDLRHTWATLALQAGVPAKVVQEILGHKNIGITLDVHSHVVPAMAEDTTSKVAALVLNR